MEKRRIEIVIEQITEISEEEGTVQLKVVAKDYNVIINGEELHPANVVVLVVNLGYSCTAEFFDAYPNDCKGWITEDNRIELDKPKCGECGTELCDEETDGAMCYDCWRWNMEEVGATF